MGEKLVERGWRRDDYLDTIRSLNGVIKRQRHSLKALHRSHNMSGKVCAGLARDMQAVRAKQREAATALTLAQAKVEALREALDLYRDAVRINVLMEGPKFMGANSSALKRAWEADRARALKEASE